MNKYNIFPLIFLFGICIVLMSCGNEVETKKPAAPITTEVTPKPTTTPEEENGSATLVSTPEKSAEEIAKEAKEAEEALTLEEKEAKAKAAKEKEEAAAKKRRAERRKNRKYGDMKFDNKTHDYGVIMTGKEFTHRFEFTNTGKSDLVISDVSASCGCTMPSYPFIPIAPGEKGYIDVVYNSAGKLGPQKSTVTITANTKDKRHRVYLKGFVDAERAEDKTTQEDN